MAYRKQTWNNGKAGGTPTSAARLNYMENGIEAVSDLADRLLQRIVTLEGGGGGTPTPNRLYDVVVILGQSNAQGAAQDFVPGVSPDTAPARTYQFGARAATVRDGAYTITPATDPLIHRWTQTGTTMGPGIPFAREYVKTMAADRSLLLVPAAYSGTGFSKTNHGSELSTHWRADDTTGVNLLTSAIDQTIAALGAAGSGARLVGFLWVQGEADEAMAPATYETYLLALIDALRARLANADTVPFIIGGMVPEGLAAVPGRKLIDGVHRGIPSKRPYTAYVPGISGQFIDSGLHYNAAGQRALGVGMEAALDDAAGNLPGTPAQVTGLTIDSTGSKSVSLRWNEVAAATGYRVEFQMPGETQWTVSQTVSDPWATVGGRSPSSQYNFRVFAVNSSGASLQPSSTVLATTVATGSLLGDLAAQAVRAYGLRRLHNRYLGPAIEVRRTSDSAVQDIPFTSSGELDEAALLAFVGTGSGFVSKRYDLTGHGLTLSQATASAQARIVNAGTIDRVNGKPSLVANVNSFYTGTFTGRSLYAGGQATVCSVVSGTATANGRYMSETSSKSTSPQYVPIMANATTASLLSQRITDNAGGSILADVGTVAAFSTTPAQISAVDLGNQWAKKINGGDGGTVSFTRSGSVDLDTFTIGGLYRNGAFGAGIGIRMLEDIVFSTAILLQERNIVEASQKSYWGTP